MPLTCLVHILLCDHDCISIVVGITDFVGNRKMLPTKSFPGAVKCTRENLFSNHWILISGKLSTMFAFPNAYSAPTITRSVIQILFFMIGVEE